MWKMATAAKETATSFLDLKSTFVLVL